MPAQTLALFRIAGIGLGTTSLLAASTRYALEEMSIDATPTLDLNRASIFN